VRSLVGKLPSPVGGGEEFRSLVSNSSGCTFKTCNIFPNVCSSTFSHFVRPDLRRIDGAPLGDAGNPGRTGVWTEGQRFQDRPAIMLSRRSNDCNPSGQTALQKLQKVLQWLNDRQ